MYDVEYAKEGKDFFLRIYIDKKEGIDLNDCEKVSNEINDMLDKSNYINQQYFLEVSSPGVERVLRKNEHLEQNIGNEIEVRLFRQIENQKIFDGILEKFDNERIYIKTASREIAISRKDIAQIKTKFNW